MINYIDCDMDEVLCDFIGGACEVHGVQREWMENFRCKGTWLIQEPLAAAKAAMINEDVEGTDYWFWKPIAKYGRDFWENLKPTEHGKELIDYLLTLGKPVTILSSPGSHPELPTLFANSVAGKAWWLNKHYPELGDNFILTRHKQRVAAGSILIDDREANIKAHIKEGGKGIIFPDEGNVLYRLADFPLNYVKAQLQFYIH